MAAVGTDRERAFGLMPNWELVPGERTPTLGPTLRLASRAVPVAEIRGVIARDVSGRDPRPTLAVLAVFAALGVVFWVGVLGLGWQARLLAAAVVFLAIGLSALHDLAWLTRVQLYRVEVLTARGETLVYATTDGDDARRLAGAVGALLAAPGGAA